MDPFTNPVVLGFAALLPLLITLVKRRAAMRARDVRPEVARHGSRGLDMDAPQRWVCPKNGEAVRCKEWAVRVPVCPDHDVRMVLGN